MKSQVILISIAFASALSAGAAAQPEPSPTLQIPEGLAVYRDLPYVTNGHQRQKLDLYVPKSKEKLPLIIRIHGGAWLEGSKETEEPGDYPSKGYAVASINYRLSQDAVFPAQIHDCKSALRFLRANAEKYNLDPDRFAAWGSSAGGHLAALLGTTGHVKGFDVGENLTISSRVQLVVDYFGPTDFLQSQAHRLPGGRDSNAPDSAESKLIGGCIVDNPEKVAKANPITYVTEAAPPFLIIHGDRDPVVPHHQSEILEIALQKAGVPVELYTVKGGRHGRFEDPNVPKLTREFFENNLKNKKHDKR